jgi:hypothetical protein
VIVEAGVATQLQAEVATTVVHVGPVDPEPPREGLLGSARPEDHLVHVFQPDDAVRVGDTVAQVNYTDSTCLTCRIAFFRVDGQHAYVGNSHQHSEDEIIHMLSGRLRLGRQLLEPGMSVAIPANRKYGFRTDGAFSFLNYRRDVSTLTMSRDSIPWLETVESLQKFMAQPSGDRGPDDAVAG